jgi:hypothetical protein
MNETETRWINDHFEKLHAELAAVIAQQGLLEAEIKAFRDTVMDLQDKPEISGDEMFRIYAQRVKEYFATIEADPQRILERVNAAVQDSR